MHLQIPALIVVVKISLELRIFFIIVFFNVFKFKIFEGNSFWKFVTSSLHERRQTAEAAEKIESEKKKVRAEF